MAADNGNHLKALGFLALVGIGVLVGVFGSWAWSAGLLPFIAALCGGSKTGQAPDLPAIEATAKAQIMAESPAAVIASLDPDTRAGIAQVESDALSEARRLSAGNAGFVGSPIPGPGQGSGG